MSRSLELSPNALIDKSIFDRYANLPAFEDRVIATYIWIDGTGEDVRAKDRTLDHSPKTPKGILIAEASSQLASHLLIHTWPD